MPIAPQFLSQYVIRWSLPLLLLVIISALTACSTHSTAPMDAASSNGILKSPNDSRDYLAFSLENELEVLVISDPEADKAAASLSVSVGSGSDPQDREGLAHFLEHMLFLGTEKYPQAGAYQQFISEHSGSHNAYTAFDETNYFFDINATDLAPALDQFAQFFIAPLFNPEYVDREKHAVNSEYQAKIKDDFRRQYELIKTHSNPNHPFSKFSVGSLSTLEERDSSPLRDDLLTFYRKHYAANRMKLVVLGTQPVAALKAMVEERFSDIPNPSVDAEQTAATPLFTNDQLPVLVKTRPNKNLRQIQYLFPIPSSRAHYRAKPLQYLINLLGHEGRGSLLSHLKSQGWADSLSAGIGFETAENAILQISIGLTEQGLKETDAITTALFEAIALIEKEGINRWRYEEQAQLSQLAFQFQESGPNINRVTHLASAMQQLPVTEVISAPYTMTEFDAPLIHQYLNALTARNMLVMLVSKEQPVNLMTEHFSAPYSAVSFTDEQLKRWSSISPSQHLKLPAPNPFIPQDTQLLEQPLQQPQKPTQRVSASGISWWHSIDTSFNTPKADFYFTLRSPLANTTASNTVLTELYVKTVLEQLNEYSYPATLAGLGYEIYPHVRGISVRLFGYHDKQPLLLKEILNALKQPIIEPSTFLGHKDELQRRWHNALKARPYQQSLRKVQQLITLPSWSEQELLEAIEPISAEQLRRFSAVFLASLDIEVLGNGNISEQTMKERIAAISGKLAVQSPTKPVTRPVVQQLPQEQPLQFNQPVDHNDHAVSLYIQGSRKDYATRAQFALIEQVLSTPFYHQLRTRQQLGYIVFSGPMPIFDVPAVVFTVQSPNTDAKAIVQAINHFLMSSNELFSNLDEKTLNTHKRALISHIMEKDNRLSDRSKRYWLEIDRKNFAFDSREKLVAAIEAMTLDQLRESYQRNVIEQPRQLLITASSQPINDAFNGYQTVEQQHLRQLSPVVSNP